MNDHQEDDYDEQAEGTPSTPSGMISDLDRKRIVKAYLAGNKPKVISEILDLPQRKIQIIIRNYSKTGRIGLMAKSFSPAATPPPVEIKIKLENSQIEVLRQWVSEDATQTNAALVQRFNESYDTNLPVSALPKLLGPFIFSISRLTLPAEILNDPRTITLRKEYCQIYAELSSMYGDSEVTYIGQMRFRMAIRDKENRGKVRLRNMSICVGIGKYEVISYLGQDAPITKKQFQEFILALIDAQKQRNHMAGVLIMEENSLSEDTDGLGDLIQARGFTNIYLPPNSPFLDPTEVLFGEIRELLVNSAPHTGLNESALVSLVTQGTRLIHNMECSRYIESVTDYVPRCLDSEAVEVADVYSIVENDEEDKATTTEEIQILYTDEV